MYTFVSNLCFGFRETRVIRFHDFDHCSAAGRRAATIFSKSLHKRQRQRRTSVEFFGQLKYESSSNPFRVFPSSCSCNFICRTKQSVDIQAYETKQLNDLQYHLLHYKGKAIRKPLAFSACSFPEAYNQIARLLLTISREITCTVKSTFVASSIMFHVELLLSSSRVPHAAGNAIPFALCTGVTIQLILFEISKILSIERRATCFGIGRNGHQSAVPLADRRCGIAKPL